MICMIPSAPAELTAFGSKSDSCLATAVSKVTGTPYWPAAWTKSGASVAGTPLPAVLAVAPAPAVAPAVAAVPAVPRPLVPRPLAPAVVAGRTRRMATGVPTGSIRTSAPVYGASIISPWPT